MRFLVATLLINCLCLTFKANAEAPATTHSKHSKQIDQLIATGLAKQNIEPNAQIDDATFLRRIYLNIGGRVPTIEEAEAFYAKPEKQRRSELINQLLNSEAYVSNAYHFWADLLRINGEPGNMVSDAYELWVKDSIRENKPYDEMVYELVTANGKIWENGAVGYYFRDRGMPLDNMSNTVRVFLGTRLECAQCHNHPFDKWTQMDYFKMASFSYGINTRGYDSPNRNMIMDHQKNAAKKAYLAKAEELTGSKEFPLMRPKESDRYEREMPEKTKIPEPVMIERFDRKTKKKIMVEKKRKFYKLTKHEKLGLTKSEFLNIVKQCQDVGLKEIGDRDVMRDVLNELYDPLQYVALSEKEKDAKLPHDYQYSDADPHKAISPATMFGKEIDLASSDEGRLKAYGSWMTDSENPTFTKVIANRMWKEVFGHGVFEPVDELTDSTFISNPELLNYLMTLMIELDYDLRTFQEILYNTKTYQRAVHQDDVALGEPYYFQGPLLRRMSAEQIWDSLVSLALPEADRYQPRLKGQIQSITRVEKIYNQLEGKPFDEFFALVQQITPLVSERRENDKENQVKLTEAIKADDQRLISKLRKEINNSRRELRRKASEIAFPFLNEKVDGEELLLAMGISTSSMGEMMDDDDTDTRQVILKLPKPELPEMPAELEENNRKNKSARKMWMNEQKNDYKKYQKLISEMARASELKSPARRGHFLRDFGQSDREVIENSSAHASVPQALNLLNGPIIQALTNNYSVFGKRLTGAGTPKEKAEMIFQAMLTRQPTQNEIELVETEFAAKGNDAYDGIVWALLNTQQFMFIQ